MTNSTIQRRVKTFHPTRQTGHQQRIKKKKRVKRKMDRVTMMKMEIVSRMTVSMKKVKNRTVMEKRAKKQLSNTKREKVKPKNKTMVAKKLRNKMNKTMVMRVNSKIMVMNNTD